MYGRGLCNFACILLHVTNKGLVQSFIHTYIHSFNFWTECAYVHQNQRRGDAGGGKFTQLCHLLLVIGYYNHVIYRTGPGRSKPF